MGENPWNTLREQPELVLVWSELPDDTAAMWEGVEIHLDYRLSRVERRCALMHELVHYERQIGWPAASTATMEKEERAVRIEAAMRLVPLGPLAEWVVRRVTVEPITAELVAQEWDVTCEVAALALSLLRLPSPFP